MTVPIKKANDMAAGPIGSYMAYSGALSYLEREQESAPTRQFPDTAFGDSSPTDLKTVPRHFWRQFPDTFVQSQMTCNW